MALDAIYLTGNGVVILSMRKDKLTPSAANVVGYLTLNGDSLQGVRDIRTAECLLSRDWSSLPTEKWDKVVGGLRSFIAGDPTRAPFRRGEYVRVLPEEMIAQHYKRFYDRDESTLTLGDSKYSLQWKMGGPALVLEDEAPGKLVKLRHQGGVSGILPSDLIRRMFSGTPGMVPSVGDMVVTGYNTVYSFEHGTEHLLGTSIPLKDTMFDKAGRTGLVLGTSSSGIAITATSGVTSTTVTTVKEA